jgi:hypothetical protein
MSSDISTIRTKLFLNDPPETSPSSDGSASSSRVNDSEPQSALSTEVGPAKLSARFTLQASALISVLNENEAKLALAEKSITGQAAAAAHLAQAIRSGDKNEIAPAAAVLGRSQGERSAVAATIAEENQAREWQGTWFIGLDHEAMPIHISQVAFDSGTKKIPLTEPEAHDLLTALTQDYRTIVAQRETLRSARAQVEVLVRDAYAQLSQLEEGSIRTVDAASALTLRVARDIRRDEADAVRAHEPSLERARMLLHTAA